MKKNLLALSISAMIGGLGFAGAANAALSVAESGTGHILVMPYYNAQNGNMSVFHLTNTDTVNGKAVKVRFRGASNSDDVLDFQVFMSPGDVWTAAVAQGADGRAQLVTADTSCTLPKISGPVSFVTDRLTKKGWTADDKAEQTREGYVEILNMSDIPKDSTLFKAVKHVNGAGTAPCTSEVLNATLGLDTTTALTGGNYQLPGTFPTGIAGTGDDLVPPTGGLTGQWYIQNVAQTTTFSGTAAAITAPAAPAAGPATTKNVFSPQKNGKAVLLTADPLMVTATLDAQHYDVPDLSTPYEAATTDAAAQAAALSTALAKTSVMNQYATDAGVFAKTDWVFSMPTRRYSIAANYSADVSQEVEASGAAATSAVPVALTNKKAYRVLNGAVATADATNIFADQTNTAVNDKGQICVTAGSSTFFDREERYQQDGAVFSPGTPTKTQLCGEVSVLAFASDASVLGATVARQNVAAPYTNGWGTVSFATLAKATQKAPVLGASFVKLQNANATPGVSGTYGITWAHSYTKN